MSVRGKISTIVIVTFLILSTFFVFFFREVVTSGENDLTPPTIETVSGDVTATSGETIPISLSYSDNIAVTSAKLFYKPASAISWSSKSILSGTASIEMPETSEENWYYYILINDEAGNGPVGKPSVDGSMYYTITVIPQLQNNPINTSEEEMPEHDTTIPHAFIEVGTKFVCSECPKITAMLDQMYKSGTYPFYYVSLPMTDPNAIERLNQLNIYGYPTMYINGGYRVLMGSKIQQSDVAQAITDALARPKPNLSVMIETQRNENTNEITSTITLNNNEVTMYQGHLRVYLTEIVSTSGEGNTPQRFLFREYLINEEIMVDSMEQKQLTNTKSLGTFDPENIMIFAVVFNTEKNTGHSQPPDQNPFDAYYVDAVAATTVVQGGNVPPAVGITYPKVNYFHRFGYPARKSLLGRTMLFGQTTIIANASDDSGVAKVEFYVNEKLMCTDNSTPYQWTWHRLTLGKRTITVKAYDDQGKTSTASIDVFVVMKWKNPLVNILPSNQKTTSGSTDDSCCS